jgi:hypothetical protein
MARRGRRPASTDENREKQLVSLANDLAERQMQEGTASSQVITHFLKSGSTREKLERERLEKEVELLQSKVDSMASAKRVEELYAAALDAMRSYAGQPLELEMDEYYED